MNSDHYCLYLYFFSNTLYRNNSNKNVFEKLYYLNKTLNSVEMFYEIELPDIFMVIHPVGTVLGRAKYSDFMTVYQNCTVGSNDEKKPELGKYLIMRPGSVVLGNSKIGNNCQLASNRILIDKNLPENSTYYGNPKNFFLKKKTKKMNGLKYFEKQDEKNIIYFILTLK